MKPLLRPFAIRLSLLLAFAFATGLTRADVPGNDDPVGINFFTGSWKDVLAEAKKRNKPVFVDIYTTWCGPCKLMARQAFPDAKVGEKFNTNFISYQIDAEKGEGIDVARKYAVTAYPTSLYVSASGDLIHRAIGYGGIKGFLDEADKAISAASDPNPLSVMEKQYEGGQREAEFLRTYLAKRAKIGMPNAEALDAFLKAAPQSEWFSNDNLEAITGNLTTAKSPAFEPLLNEIKSMRLNPSRMKGMQSAMQAVSQAVGRDERQAKTEAELDQAIANSLKMRTALSMKAVPEADQKTAANESRMAFYRRTKNLTKYGEYATESASRLMAITPEELATKDNATYQSFLTMTRSMPDSIKARPQFKRDEQLFKTMETQQIGTKLNSLAWAYFETMTSSADLNKALSWSARSLELQRNPAYLDTYAQLLGKLGRKAEAVAVEQEALEKAKETGEDTADYEKTLATLKK
ncbi:thioredoxin family protein [Fibrella arboris]|uniref:thioredoxin family protein n=1 Tax=Fibrella arboris TaxID=3242486 RepID=UPI0035203F8C